MKLMIASDIHGSAYYCEKMIEAYKREKLTNYYYYVTFFIMGQEMICQKTTTQRLSLLC